MVLSALLRTKRKQVLIIAIITTLKRSSRKCDRNEAFHLAQSSLDSDVTRDKFDELLRNMIEINTVKL